MCNALECITTIYLSNDWGLEFVVSESLPRKPTCEVFLCVLNWLLGQYLHSSLLHSNHFCHRYWNFNQWDKCTQLKLQWNRILTTTLTALFAIVIQAEVSLIKWNGCILFWCSNARALLQAFLTSHTQSTAVTNNIDKDWFYLAASVSVSGHCECWLTAQTGTQSHWECCL